MRSVVDRWPPLGAALVLVLFVSAGFTALMEDPTHEGRLVGPDLPADRTEGHSGPVDADVMAIAAALDEGRSGVVFQENGQAPSPHEQNLHGLAPRSLTTNADRPGLPDTGLWFEQAADGTWTGRAVDQSILVLDDRLILGEGGNAIVVTWPGTARAIEPLEPLPTRSHYFIGDDPAAWRQDVARHGALRLHDVLPGLDIRLYGVEGRLEFDHELAAGADPALAGFRVTDRAGTPLDVQVDEGALVVEHGSGTWSFSPPRSHQEGQAVASAFAPRGDGHVGYHLGELDPGLPLVIDPMTKFSTYLGSSGRQYVRDIAYLSAAPHRYDLVVVGESQTSASNGFPSGFTNTGINGVGGTSGGGSYEAFAAKYTYDLINHTVTADWFTYLGGSSTDYAKAVALDANRILVAGYTGSSNFPTTSGALTNPNGAPYDGSKKLGGDDGFVVALDLSGSLVRSTFIGSSTRDILEDIAIAPNGNVIVGGWVRPGYAGTRYDVYWPTTLDAPQPLPSDQNGFDGVVAVLDLTATSAQIVWSTYHSGAVVADKVMAVAADATGYYAAGYAGTVASTTAGGAFPTTPGAFQEEPVGDGAPYVTKFQPDGTDYVYSTYIDGDGSQFGYDLVVSSGGSAWVAGITHSGQLPFPASPGPFMTTPPGGIDGWMAHLHADGSALLYGTYFGTPDADYFGGFDHNEVSGHVAMLMNTEGTLATPHRAPYPVAPSGGASNDLIMLHLDPAAGTSWTTTYYGGSDRDDGAALAIDRHWNHFVGGSTLSVDFPTQDPVQPTLAALNDGTVSNIGKVPPTAEIEFSAPGVATLNTTAITATNPVTGNKLYQVDAGAKVAMEDVSWAGDFALDPLNIWTLHDDTGALIDGPGSGTGPSWSPYQGSAGFVTVCLEVTDTDPYGAYDRTDKVCGDVAWANADPDAVDDAFSMSEDTGPIAFDVLANDADPDGHTVSVTAASHADGLGAVSFDAGKVYFTPIADFHNSPARPWGGAPVEVIYTIEDSHDGKDTAFLNITVENVNDGVQAVDDAITTESALDIDVLANDVLQPAVYPDPAETAALVILTGPNHGSAAVTAGKVRYTPDPGFLGTDSFVYRVSDDNGASDTAMVTVDVVPVGGVLARDDTASATEDGPQVTIDVLANDIGPDADPPATLQAVSDPPHGTTAIADGKITYRPDPDVFGIRTFTYDLVRRTTTSTATVTIHIGPVNDPPNAVDDDFGLMEDSVGNVLPVLGNDGSLPDDDEALAVVAVGQAASGTAVLSEGQVHYTPDPDFFGTDSFTYTIADPDGAQATATITVLIDDLPDTPVAVDDTYTVSAGLPDQVLHVTQNDVDVDGDALDIVEVEWNETYGSLTVDGGALKVSPGKTFIGEVELRYRVTDGDLESGWAAVTLDVVAPDDPLLVLRVLTAPLCSEDPIDVRGFALQSDRVATVWNWSVDGQTETFNSVGDLHEWGFITEAGRTDVTLSVRFEDDQETGNWASETWPLDVIKCIGPAADFTFTTDGQKVHFKDGSSDADGDRVAWQWDFGDGTSSAEPSPAHTYAKGGHYLVRLTVTDDDGNTHTAERVVTVVGEGGSGGGPGSDPAGITEAATDDADRATDAGPAAGGHRSGAEDRPPVAVASAPRQATSGDTVVLDGSASHDPDGDALTYRWSQVGGPSLVLLDPDSSKTTFTAPDSGELRFRLHVEGGGKADRAEVLVRIDAVPRADFSVEIGERVRLTDTSQNAEGATRTWTIDGHEHQGADLLLDLAPGEHEVRLVVESGSGRSESVQTVFVPELMLPDGIQATQAPPLSVEQDPTANAQAPVLGWGIVAVLALSVLLAVAWLLRRR